MVEWWCLGIILIPLVVIYKLTSKFALPRNIYVSDHNSQVNASQTCIIKLLIQQESFLDNKIASI